MKNDFYIKDEPHIKTRDEIICQQQRILRKIGFTELQALVIPLLLFPLDLDYLEAKVDERLKNENEIHGDSD